MNKEKIKPPKICEKILCYFLPEEDSCSLLGDYEETFKDHSQSRGKFRAYMWYIWQIFKTIPTFISETIYWSITMFKNYVKTALRTFFKQKIYSFINILGLSIGITACVLMFLYIGYEFSYDRFNENFNEIYRIGNETNITGTMQKTVMTSGPMAPTLKNDFPEIVNAVRIGTYFKDMTVPKVLIKHEDRQFYEDGILFADSTFLDMFSFPLKLGNKDKALDEPFSILITEEYAKKYFGNENPLGKTLNFENKHDFRVTGVLENIPFNSHLRFNILSSFSSMKILFGKNRYLFEHWLATAYNSYIQLPKGYNPDDLEQKLSAFVDKHFGAMSKATGFKMNLFLQPIRRIHLYSNLFGEFGEIGGYNDIKYIYIFTAAALFILLIACINFVNLTTARSSARIKEIGMRKIIGANRQQMVRQFIGESMLMSLCSLIISFIFVLLILPEFNSLTERKISLNLENCIPLILISLIFTVFLGMVSGIYPAVYLSAFHPVNILKNSPGGIKRKFFRKFLVVFQFVISIVLINGTIIIYNQMNYIKNKNLGFDKEQIVVMPVRDTGIKQNYRSLKNELLQNPLVINAATASSVPGDIIITSAYWVEGAKRNDISSIRTIWVDYDYINTLGLKIIQGRDFSRDFPADISSSFIINQAAAEKFGWEEPINKKITWFSTTRKEGKVIGVVKDFHSSSLHQAIEPIVFQMNPEFLNQLLLKVNPENITSVLSSIETTWNNFAPNIPFECYFLDNRFDSQYRVDRKIKDIFLYFTGLGIFIACMGLFGLASFTSEQRIKEIGIRKVLGASVTGIVSLLSKDFIKLVLISNIFAWPISYLIMNKWLENFAYKINIGIASFIFSAVLAVLIALFTVSFQAFKAAITNPVDTLKYE